jgi:NAD(P)-dependent dehydrogenase (short-subunit alcohol dehydrogenase family)
MLTPHETEVRACALITGAAGGIGTATARLLVKQGWFVGVADLDEGRLSELMTELGPDNAIAIPLDVVNTQAWERALAGFFARTGRLDLLINNAGILASGPFESTPLERHHAQVNVNIMGVLNGCYFAKPYLAATKTPGRVINLSSASATYGQASLAAYSMTKFAVRGLTEALNIEWQIDGIRVMDIMPMFVQTEMIRDMNAQSIRKMGVHLTPEDVAGVIWKAATYRGSYGKVHWPVGFMAAWFHRMTNLSPDRLSRFIARQIAT